MNVLKTLKYLFPFLCGLSLPLEVDAQSEFPTTEEMNGDFILMNYKSYEGETETTTAIAETRPFVLTANEEDNTMVAEGFYQRGMPSLNMNYIPATGNIQIPAGQVVFAYADGEGSIMYLYGWDERNEMVSERPIVYRYEGGGCWRCTQPLMLMAGMIQDGELVGDLQPYVHSQGSVIARANATVNDVAYDGDAVEYREERPAYMTVSDRTISIYNLTQVDGQGNGSWVNFAYLPATGQALAFPTLIGDAPSDLDYPYKALTGCIYNEQTNRPTDINHVELNGKDYEGLIVSAVDMDNGEMVFEPMAVWPSTYSSAGWNIDLTRFYEVYSEMTVSFIPEEVLGINHVTTDNVEADILRTDYFTPDGRLVKKPLPGQVIIQRITRADGTTESHKIIQK